MVDMATALSRPGQMEATPQNAAAEVKLRANRRVAERLAGMDMHSGDSEWLDGSDHLPRLIIHNWSIHCPWFIKANAKRPGHIFANMAENRPVANASHIETHQKPSEARERPISCRHDSYTTHKIHRP